MKKYKSPVVVINGYDVDKERIMHYTGNDEMDICIFKANLLSYITDVSSKLNTPELGNRDPHSVVYTINSIPNSVYLKVLNASEELYPIKYPPQVHLQVAKLNAGLHLQWLPLH